MKRKLLAFAFSLSMVFSLVPAASLQAEEMDGKASSETTVAEGNAKIVSLPDGGEVDEIVEYVTSTAAGTAPILPDSVVAKGLIFDESTPSLKTANNNVDLGETFDSKLIPVTWEAVEPASYGADKVILGARNLLLQRLGTMRLLAVRKPQVQRLAQRSRRLARRHSTTARS